MSVSRETLIAELDQLLNIAKLNDYCPNGLQVEGRKDISKVALAVSASQHVIDQAVAQNADALLVHHGYFWQSEAQVITGMKAKRISTLLRNDLNLIAYHLPLDVHAEYGNNAQLAKQCHWTVETFATVDAIPQLLWIGTLEKPTFLNDFSLQLYEQLGRQPLCIAGHDRAISRIAWCTGAAQRYLKEATAYKVDAYISGEISENTTYLARELGVHYIAAGHYATECYGVQALGRYLEKQFKLSCFFIEEDNPV